MRQRMTGLCFTSAIFINLQHDIIFYHSETEMHFYLFYNLDNNFSNTDFSVKSAVRSTLYIFITCLLNKAKQCLLDLGTNYGFCVRTG